MVRDEHIEVGTQDADDIRGLRHARALDEPLADIDGFSAVDSDARFVEGLMNDGLLGDFSVVAVTSGEAFSADGRRNGSNDEVRGVVFVHENCACCRFGLNPSGVRPFGVAAGELVPVIRLPPFTKGEIALVTPLGNKMVGDGRTAFGVGHISPKGPRMLDYSVTFYNLWCQSFTKIIM